MKKFTLSVAAVMAMSTFAIAGGDVKDVEPAVEPVVKVAVVDDSSFYLGLAYSMANFTEDYDNKGMFTDRVGTYEEDYNAIMLQAGYKINKYLAVEGRYWKSVGDADWSNKGEESGMMPAAEENGDSYPYNYSGTNDNELTAWGLYVKPMYPVTDALDVYALLGYGNVTLSTDEGDMLDENGFQWGLGTSYSFTNNLSVFVDYIELYNDDGAFDDLFGIDTWEETIYTVNLGVTYKF